MPLTLRSSLTEGYTFLNLAPQPSRPLHAGRLLCQLARCVLVHGLTRWLLWDPTETKQMHVSEDNFPTLKSSPAGGLGEGVDSMYIKAILIKLPEGCRSRDPGLSSLETKKKPDGRF